MSFWRRRAGLAARPPPTRRDHRSTEFASWGSPVRARHAPPNECRDCGLQRWGPQPFRDRLAALWLHPAPDEAATSAAPRAEAVNLIRRDRAPEALQLQLADRGSVERVFHGREDALADQDLPTSRNRAQPGGEARDRPQCPVVVATFEADPPQCRVSGFDSDAKRQVDAALQPTRASSPKRS